MWKKNCLTRFSMFTILIGLLLLASRFCFFKIKLITMNEKMSIILCFVGTNLTILISSISIVRNSLPKVILTQDRHQTSNHKYMTVELQICLSKYFSWRKDTFYAKMPCIMHFETEEATAIRARSLIRYCHMHATEIHYAFEKTNGRILAANPFDPSNAKQYPDEPLLTSR